MRHWSLSAAITAAILNTGSSSARPAQDALSGSYVLDRERSDDVFQAIENAVAGLPTATRSLARAKLRKSTAVDRIRIASSGSRFSIKYDAHPVIVVSLSGEPIKWTLVRELVFDVSAKANGEAVSLTFHASDNERTIVYRRVGQQLAAETTIVSPQFSTPIRFTTVYNPTR